MSQEWSLTPQVQQPKRRGRGLIWSGVVLLVLAVVLGLAGAVGIGRGVGSIASSSTAPVDTPATFTADLEAGRTYVLWQLTGPGGAVTVAPEEVVVLGQGTGDAVVSSAGSVTQTFESNGDSFTAAASIVASETGTYVVQVATPGATVLVGPGLDSLVGLGIWGLLIVLAVLLGLVGLILLVIGLVVRASTPKPAYGGATYLGTPQAGGPVGDPYAAQPVQQAYPPAQPVQPAAPVQPALPPAGWYPDPARPGGQRYWNGERWTEHQA